MSQPAQVRRNAEGKEFLSFKITVNIPAAGTVRAVEISVAKDGGDLASLATYPLQSRVALAGVLTFNKKAETMYWNLSADSIAPAQEGAPDAITGVMEFIGTTGKKIEQKVSKNEKQYLKFDAYSSKKTAEEITFTWVHFNYYTPEIPEWLAEKTHIKASGRFDVSFYNDNLDLRCVVQKLEKWEKQQSTTETKEQ